MWRDSHAITAITGTVPMIGEITGTVPFAITGTVPMIGEITGTVPLIEE